MNSELFSNTDAVSCATSCLFGLFKGRILKEGMFLSRVILQKLTKENSNEKIHSDSKEAN